MGTGTPRRGRCRAPRCEVTRDECQKMMLGNFFARIGTARIGTARTLRPRRWGFIAEDHRRYHRARVVEMWQRVDSRRGHHEGYQRSQSRDSRLFGILDGSELGAYLGSSLRGLLRPPRHGPAPSRAHPSPSSGVDPSSPQRRATLPVSAPPAVCEPESGVPSRLGKNFLGRDESDETATFENEGL